MDATDDEDRVSVNDMQYDQDKELDMTLKQNNMYMFDTPGTGDDITYDDTIKPDQVQAFKREMLNQQQNDSGYSQSTIKADSSLSRSNTQSSMNRGTASSTQSNWNEYFASLTPDTLQTLFDMVEKNEALEIQSIRNEFEPKLSPIIEGVSFRRQQYSQIRK
jgi:hypothetical protein